MKVTCLGTGLPEPSLKITSFVYLVEVENNKFPQVTKKSMLVLQIAKLAYKFKVLCSY